jgi:hypothetical protein
LVTSVRENETTFENRAETVVDGNFALLREGANWVR